LAHTRPDIDDYFEIDVRAPRRTALISALAEPNFWTLRYTYDFSDDWEHRNKVERRFTAELWDEFPRLIGAKGRCPPVYIGAPWGYAQPLAAMSDAHHPRHTELIKLLGRRGSGEIDRPAMEAALAHFVKPLWRTPRRTTNPRAA
jgi:hypothetical protein